MMPNVTVLFTVGSGSFPVFAWASPPAGGLAWLAAAGVAAALAIGILAARESRRTLKPPAPIRCDRLAVAV